MASLLLKNIYKVYDSGVTAVTDFNLDIQDKEFIIFVGPSGCGKSTTLRMIAGLEEISAGELYIDGKLMNTVSPKDRDIAFVFQSYALYPHMSVYDNMAFGLKLRKMPKAEIDARVREAARILGIEMYLTRKPKALSGGQRQRVALGRAIVREPKVFLLDEPLSNLDAKLRAQMRTEITKLHHRLATTFIYVTHDQIEAMTMGTRIVVMKDGFIQQVDTPQNLYDFPVNKFVAGFIGSPQMNFFNATLTSDGKDIFVEFGADKVKLPKEKAELLLNPSEYVNTGKQIVFGIRPEDLHDDPEYIERTGFPTIDVSVDITEMLGAEMQLYCKTKSALEESANVESIVDDTSTVIARVDSRSQTKPNDIVKLALDLAHSHMFDAETEMTILARNLEDKKAQLGE
ncbi:MAG: sn-glycerol-3-phosphate ABC transporter ATP-binding protein UgpC [Clostridia bacterium]|nr:sn-glycerol-3-phosphate ABC transporter ATP-binding protein UgpC [Clostridia bacterium]